MPRDTTRLLDEEDLIRWREATMTAIPSKDESEAVSGDSNRSNFGSPTLPALPDFHKATIQLRADPKMSLLTKALQPSQDDDSSETFMAIDMARHRSARSTTSSASTADLTSDGGFTSPTRTSTPSPPFPPSSYMSLAPYTLGPKLSQTAFPRAQQNGQKPPVTQNAVTAAILKPDPAVEALVKKRCISFACAAEKPQDFIKPTTSIPNSKNIPSTTNPGPKRTIKFACHGLQSNTQVASVVEHAKASRVTVIPASPPAKTSEQLMTRSPSLSRKLRSSTPQPKAHRDSTSTIRRASQSPAAVRTRKPKYIVADEDALELSEATRFHEFASDEPQEDDWIRKDTSNIKGKLTIHDTLRKENAIRQLGKEAEEEALEDDDDDDADDDDNDDDDDDDDDEDDDEDEDIEFEDDDNTVDGSDVDLDASDGNETDNEAGFADSDDESDRGGEYQFWASRMTSGEANAFRSSVTRAPSESSIDSLSHMSPNVDAKAVRSGKTKPSRKIRIRPGTPDLPDSTDFVCGTLDEDRPLEEAYVSCMEARKREKRHVIPQDIDPSFPTSDPEEEDDDDNDEVEQTNDSDEGLWLHGKFEDSESETRHRRRTRKSPKHSPKRLVSPPPNHYRSPPTGRLRSPPPRRHVGQSPKRANSPPPARVIQWPPATSTDLRDGIVFAAMEDRPDPTHTKSLPRRPNAFCQQYRTAQLAFANCVDDNDNTDGYTRGAIDIVKGLEQKRQRRKDKFFSKLCNRARKGQHVERRPQPGKGAERMRELGLQMAGKNVDYKNGNAEYVLSV